MNSEGQTYDHSLKAGLKALATLRSNEAPRGSQTWEVPAHTPDILGSSNLADCHLMAFALTDDRRHLDEAREWLYKGLPFLYAYRVPGTGPGVKALVPDPQQHPGAGSAFYGDLDVHEVTHYGSIPVFGTSLYRVPWFGTLVQFCGLVWAKSVFDYLEYADDPILRMAAEGATQVGISMTRDVEPYVGLLPDSWMLA